jgi:hypothetical protein
MQEGHMQAHHSYVVPPNIPLLGDMNRTLRNLTWIKQNPLLGNLKLLALLQNYRWTSTVEVEFQAVD